jgi:AraC-like DNA-binding protein
MSEGTDTFNEVLFGKFLQSELLSTCQQVFRCATGLPVKFLRRDSDLQTQVVEPERYQRMVTLLARFGEQLGEHAEKLAIPSEGNEPEAVTRARKFIEIALADPLPLPLVARQAGLSESPVCRVFKEATGLTLTDYINRRRIGWAKRELLKPQARVSEIAFRIGYQSLSQFNRSFARFTGNLRREELSKLAAG